MKIINDGWNVFFAWRILDHLFKKCIIIEYTVCNDLLRISVPHMEAEPASEHQQPEISGICICL